MAFAVCLWQAITPGPTIAAALCNGTDQVKSGSLATDTHYVKEGSLGATWY